MRFPFKICNFDSFSREGFVQDCANPIYLHKLSEPLEVVILLKFSHHLIKQYTVSYHYSPDLIFNINIYLLKLFRHRKPNNK